MGYLTLDDNVPAPRQTAAPAKTDNPIIQAGLKGMMSSVDAYTGSSTLTLKIRNGGKLSLMGNTLIYPDKDNDGKTITRQIQLGPMSKARIEKFIKSNANTPLERDVNYSSGKVVLRNNEGETVLDCALDQANEFRLSVITPVDGYEPATIDETFSLRPNEDDAKQIVETKHRESYVEFNKLPKEKIIQYLNGQEKASEGLKVFVAKLFNKELSLDDFPKSELAYWSGYLGQKTINLYQNFDSSKGYQFKFNINKDGDMTFLAKSTNDSNLSLKIQSSSDGKLHVGY